MLKSYYWLAKPGIVYGNLLPAIAGFMLAAGRGLDWPLFLETIAGLGLVIASACVVNNVIDRRIDAKMARTSWRATVTGQVSPRAALAYAAALGVLGFGLLIAFTPAITVIAAAVGFLDYVILYGLAKRGTVHSTLIGSISGAVPPVVGYTAVTGHLDFAAWLLFTILVLWQMPHFYAIAIYRFKDYKAAGLPVLTVKQGFQAAKWQIMAYALAFSVAVGLLWLLGYTGYLYLVVMLILCLVWLGKGIIGFRQRNDEPWARSMFLFSLIIITTWSLLLMFNAWLP